MIETIKLSDLDVNLASDELTLNRKEVKNDLSTIYGIPQTLAIVDERHGTHTFADVLRAITPEVQVLREGDAIQVLDPRADYVDDTILDSMVENLPDSITVVTNKKKSPFERELQLQFPEDDKSTFMGDLFRKEVLITRKPVGGVSMNVNMMRLVCTNGAMIRDKQFSRDLRKLSNPKDDIAYMVDCGNQFDVGKFLESKFYANGEELPCSVQTLIEMNSTLTKIAGPDVAGSLFPVEAITEFYGAQDIDIKKIAGKYRQMLPTGLTYYQAFNILTNGAKQAVDDDLKTKIEISKYLVPSRISSMKKVELSYQGTPVFPTDKIKFWMGDTL